MGTALLAASLASYRLARLVARDALTENWRARVMARRQDDRLGYLLRCPFCLSFWIAAPAAAAAVAIGRPHGGWPWLPFWWVAVAGGACLLAAADEALTTWRGVAP